MSDPVVEELRDKGVAAVDCLAAKGYVLDDYEHGEVVELVLDAVFPGWREGITRTREPMLFGEQLRIRQITTIRGPWVPVEEGTT